MIEQFGGVDIVGEIKVTIEEFKSAALQFSKAAENTDKIQQALQKTTDTLLQSWKGKGKDAFNNEYQIILKNMYTYSEVIKDISKELTAVEKQFENQDLDISSKLSKSGVIK